MFNNLLPSSVLTNRGYRINYEDITETQKKKLKEDLTICVEDPFNVNTDKYYLFHKAANKYLYIPRYYAEDNIGKALRINMKEPLTANMKFNGELKIFQQEIVDKIIPDIKKKGGGIISLPCGFGKTVIGIYIACVLKLKTIIIVNKIELLKQWIERINQFCSNCNIGTIVQDTIDIDNKDIVIAMLHSVSMRDYDKNIFKDFGLMIVDECHHISSKTFSKALYKINTKYTIGLSATPHRKDNLEYIYKWYLGDMLYVLSQKKNNDVNVCVINFHSFDKKFKETRKYNIKQRRDMFNHVCSINNLVEVNDRNIIILNIVKELIKNPLRKILVLSDRVAHLQQLNTLMNNYIKQNNLSVKSCIFIGNSKNDEKKDAIENGDIIFGSYSIAQEGLDIPRMNTLILSTPQKDIVQSIGRIMRKYNPDCKPLIIDLADNLPSWSRYLQARLKTYYNNNYNIHTFSYFNSKLYINPFINNKKTIDLSNDFNECEIKDVKLSDITDNITKSMFSLYDYYNLNLKSNKSSNKNKFTDEVDNIDDDKEDIDDDDIDDDKEDIDEDEKNDIINNYNIISKHITTLNNILNL